MTYYEVLLFLHIAFVILWLGAGVLFHILGFRADRAGNEAAMRQIFDDLVALGNTFFVPSSLLVVIFGILLTIEGPWSFGDLWIVLGLVGFGLTFATGLLWIVPQSERVKRTIERDGGMSPEAYALARRMMVFARIDYVVLMLIVFDMAVKPTRDDVGTLVLMAAVFVVGACYFLVRARSMEVGGRAARQTV
jgi:uncharacterized membrane protein